MIEKSRVPVVTLLLIVANLVAAFAVAYNPELVMDLGFNPKNPTFSTIFTSIFIHQNLLHLLGNMIFLAAVGAAVELATGSLRFLAVFLVSGLVGVVTHFMFTMAQPDPEILIGASGGIAGCAAYYSVRYTHLQVPVAPKRGLSVAVVTAVWLILQFVGAFVHIGNASNVSFWAHIGGFLAGLILSALFRAPDLGHRKLGHEVLDKMNERGPAAVALAARQHLKDHPNDLRALNDLCESERLLAHPLAEAEALNKLLSVQPEDQQGATIARLNELGELPKIASLRRTQIADRLRESDPDASRILLASVIDGADDDPRIPDAMLALAALERDHDPEQSRRILDQLAAKYPLHASVEVAKQRGWMP